MKAKIRNILLALALMVSLVGTASAAPANSAGGHGYYVVQFSGPILEEWRAALEASGAEILVYLTDFGYKVRLNPAQASQAAALDGVTGVTPFQASQKLSRNLLKDGATHLYRVRVERGADAGLATAAIA